MKYGKPVAVKASLKTTRTGPALFQDWSGLDAGVSLMGQLGRIQIVLAGRDMAGRLQEFYADLEKKVEERTKELARRQSELRVTFDNMGDGMVMFDGEFKLVSRNRNLQQILDIPDAFFATPRTYQDYIGHLIKSGDFGDVDLNIELRNFTASAGLQSTIERTRPMGESWKCATTRSRPAALS